MRRSRRPLAVAAAAVVGLAGFAGAVGLMSGPAQELPRVTLTEVGDKAVVSFARQPEEGTVEVVVNTIVGQGRLVLQEVEGDGDLKFELAELPAKATMGGRSYDLRAGGPAVKLEADGFEFGTVEFCLPYDINRGDGRTRPRFLHVEESPRGNRLEDATRSVGAASACGKARSFSTFAAGWLSDGERGLPLPPTPTTTPSATTPTTSPSGAVPTTGSNLASLLDTTTSVPTRAETPTTTTPPIQGVTLDTNVPANGALVNASGIGPGYLSQRCVTVTADSPGGAAGDLRTYFRPLTASSAALPNLLMVTLEETSGGSAACGSQTRERVLVAETTLADLQARHGSFATGTGAAKVADGEARTYRLTMSLPAETANFSQATAQFEWWWEVRS